MEVQFPEYLSARLDFAPLVRPQQFHAGTLAMPDIEGR